MFFLVAFRHLGRAIRMGWTDPEFRVLLSSVLALIGLGVLFYTRVEGWSVLDSFYFVIITMTTVGYGDLSPVTAAGKLVTVFFILVGIGLFLAFVSRIASLATASAAQARKAKKAKKKKKKNKPLPHPDAPQQPR